MAEELLPIAPLSPAQQSFPAQSFQSEECVERLKALADPVRMRIVELLRDRTLHVTAIATALELDVVIVSHHLRILLQVGLLLREKRGRFAHYRLREGTAPPGEINLGCCHLRLPTE